MPSGGQRKVIYKAKGLYTYANQFSAPEGAMSAALDVVIDKPGVIEARQNYVDQIFPPGGAGGGYAGVHQPNSGINNIFYSNSCTAVAMGGGIFGGYNPIYGLYDSLNGQVFAIDNASATTSIGEVFSSFRANGNNYFVSGGKIGSANRTGSNKVFRLDTSAAFSPNTCRSVGCGMPEALTPVDYAGTAGSGFAGLTAAASTVLSAGGQRAYRILYATKDLQFNLVRGAPSGRCIVYSVGAYTFGLLIPLPKGQLYAGDIVQIYGSEIAAASTINEPSDIMFQLAEYILQPADITNGYFTFQDTVSAGYGQALYTNDTQDGILAAEARPPNCALGVYHKNVAWYGGVSTKFQAVTLGVAGLAGWSTGAGTESQFAINGVTYKAATAEDLPNHKFQLFTTGSPGQNNANTLRSIARAISWNNAAIYAYYATPANSIQFQIAIKTLQMGDSATYTLTQANIPTTSPTVPNGTLTLREDAKTSRLYFSKPSQPESVPDLNYLSIGSPEADITGLASLRDSLFVFKTDGLFRVTGTTANDIRVTLFDATVKMYPGQFPSIAKAGNQVFALCNQGVISITESGVQVISMPIDNIIRGYSQQSVSLGTQGYGGVGRAPFIAMGAAVDGGRKYAIVLADANGYVDTQYAQKMYVYNYIQNTWVQWTPPTGCAGIADYYANSSTEFFIFPRCDAFTGFINLVTLTGAPADNSKFSYCVEDDDNPGLLKRFYDIRVILTGTQLASQISCTFSSDSGAVDTTVTQTLANYPYAVVFEVPREHSQCGQMTFTIQGTTGMTAFVVQGVVVSYEILGDRLPGARG